jgi:flavin-dependent dehydrogenase
MADPAVCVLGAGPAGCVIAYRLATLGHDVALVARTHARRHPMGETVPASVERVLEAVGLGDVVPMAAYGVATDGLVLWESEAPVARPSPTLLLRRDRFDALLCMAAERAGVRVLRSAAGATPRRRPEGGWQASFTTATVGECIEAPFFVDARGRRGGTRRLGAATIALAARWQDASPLPAVTCLEASSDAWAWGGVAPDGRQAAACFVDPQLVAGLDPTGRMALYLKLLDRMRLLRPLLTGRACEPPVVFDATARLGLHIAEPGMIAVGDARLATEPLSSQGIQGAIVSGLQGAAVVHTALTQPENATLALDFHCTSCLAAASSAVRHTAFFHSAVLARFDTSFWRSRAKGTEQPPPKRVDARVPDVSLRLSPSARIKDGPVLDGVVIRRQRVLEDPALQGQVAFLGAINVASLIEATQFPMLRSELFRAWSKMIGPKDADTTIAWLWSRGLLVPA